MIGSLIFIISLTVYLLTISPTISIGDSPELVSASYALGIAHPPGYPLYTLLGKASSILGGSPAFTSNLLSAVLGAVTSILLYSSALKAMRLMRDGDGPTSLTDRVSSALAALVLSFSPIFWSQSVISEVYALNAVLFSSLVFLHLQWIDRSRISGTGASSIYLIFFIWGLSLGNHHTMLAFGPVFTFFILLSLLYPYGYRQDKSNICNLKTFSISIFFILFGLSIYIYLPLRSTQNPFMDWGNAERIDGFIEVITRWQFGLGSRAYSFDRSIAQVSYYLSVLREQFSLAGVLIGFIGFVFFISRSLLPALFTFSLFFIHSIFTVLFLNPKQLDLFAMDIMIIPSFIIFGIWIAIGSLFIISGALALFIKSMTPFKEKVVIISSILILASIPAYSLYSNYRSQDQSKNTFARDYAIDMLDTIEQNGVIFVDADLSLFPAWYLQSVEGIRRDVAVVSTEMLMLPWFKTQMRDKYHGIQIKVPDVVKHSGGGRFKPLSMEAMISYKVAQVDGIVDELMKKHSIYFSYDFGIPYNEFSQREDLKLSRSGVIFKLSTEAIPDTILQNYSALKSISTAVNSKDEAVLFIGRAYIPSLFGAAVERLFLDEGEWSTQAFETILKVDPSHSASLNALAFQYADKGRYLESAERMIKQALRINPFERTRYLKTLGLVYLKKGETEKAISTFEDILKVEPGSEWTRKHLREAMLKRASLK